MLMFDWQMVYEPTLQLGDILLQLSSGLILRRQPTSPSFCHRWSGRVSPGRQWQQGCQGHRWHMQPRQLHLSKAKISSHRKSASPIWEMFLSNLLMGDMNHQPRYGWLLRYFLFYQHVVVYLNLMGFPIILGAMERCNFTKSEPAWSQSLSWQKEVANLRF